MKLRYDSRAIADLEGIFDYISEFDVRAATKVLARIKSVAEQLQDHPFLGRVSDMPPVRVRSIVNFPYLVFYSVGDSDVVILHVRHTAPRRPEPGDI